MEELRHELQRKRALMEKIEAQMGDLALYSVKVNHYLEMANLSLAGADVALENKNYARALYYYGRACTNLGGLLERGREERDCRCQKTTSISSIPGNSTPTP